LDANWRVVVLLGLNAASYKFALAKTLLGLADRADGRVSLEELAAPFARHLCEHLARVELTFVERGYSVVAFDASAEMVRLARERIAGRAEVLQMRFEDVAWRGELGGIWACASLLHVRSAAFPDVAARLAGALQPGGAWYVSFKLGAGERMAEGRLFVDHTEETLRCALAGVPVEIVEAWTTEDVQPGRRGERWLNAVAQRR